MRTPNKFRHDTARPSKTRSAIERMADGVVRLEDIDITAGGVITGPDDVEDWYAAAFGVADRFWVADRNAWAAAKYEIFQFENLLRDGLRSRVLEEECVDALAIATGGKGMPERLLLANSKIRLQATSILRNEVVALWKATRSTPHRVWLSLTFVGDCGNSLEYRPDIRIEPFRRRVDKMLREAGLNAVMAMEIQPLSNFPRNGDGGTLMLHSHAIGWTDDISWTEDSDIKAQAIETKMRESNRLTHWLDAPTVVVKAIPDTERHIAWMCYYLLKAPSVGKFMARSKTTSSGWEFRHTLLRPDQAVRLTEGLLQIEFTDVVFGVNDGKLITRALRSRLRAWHKAQLEQRTAILCADYDMAGLCDAMRSSRGGVRRLPYEFHDASIVGESVWSQARDRAMFEMVRQAARRRKAQAEWRRNGGSA